MKLGLIKYPIVNLSKTHHKSKLPPKKFWNLFLLKKTNRKQSNLARPHHWSAYIDAQHLVISESEYEIHLVGRVPPDTS